MLKALLGIIIFAIFSLLGFLYGEKYGKRVVHLKECYKGITLLQNQVIYSNTPLPEAFMEIKDSMKNPYSEILREASISLSDCINDNITDAFKEASLTYIDNIYLNKEDTRVISQFLLSLGDTSVYCQDKMFCIALENLKSNLKEAEESSNTNTKLYRYLGICFGAMIGILII